MKKYYLPIYCLGLFLLFFISEVFLLSKTEHELEISKIKDRYPVDDPDDLIDDYVDQEQQTNSKSSNATKVLSRILRDSSSTEKPQLGSLDCSIFDKKQCMIKGLSDFNAHYQIDNGQEIISCIIDSPNIFEICQYEKEFKKIKFSKLPVLPVLKLENKRVLEIGSKFFFVDKSNNPINVDSRSGLQSATISKLSVRFSGDCKINQILMSSPYQIKIRSEEPIGYIIKNVKDSKLGKIKTISGDSTINFSPSELDGNHFLLCGDRSSLITKVDIPVRNCVSKFSEELKKIFFCTNFSYFKWLFVFLMIFFPINWLIWKTKDSLVIWYDMIGIITYPILWIMNRLWPYFPLRCKICGCFSLLTHKCSEKCICNQSKPSRNHTSECSLFTKDRTEWNTMSLIQQFQFTINTKLSTNFLVFITKMIVASILLSYLPSSIALNKNVCVDKCYFSSDLKSMTTNKNGITNNQFETCECSIGNVITETIYQDEIPVSRATSVNTCITGSIACMTGGNQVEDLFAYRYGCSSLASIKNIPETGFISQYKGLAFSGNLTSLKIANRLRNGYLDDLSESKMLEKESSKEYKFYETLKVEDIPPENLMPRQSLVFSSEVDGNYRYMIEMDIKAETGSIYLMYVLSPSKDYSIIDEENNKLYMEKNFLVGKLKVIVEMPKEMFKKLPSKPILSETKAICSGCAQCAMGISCNLTYTSDTTFSSRLMMDSCSFKSDQVGTVLGPNEKNIKAYCSDEVESKSLKLIPEDQSELTVDILINEFITVDQDTIIHFDDKSAHDENKHHSDTSLSTLWDWVKAPFNWIASFFGTFFDMVRVIMVIFAVCVGIYIFSYIYKLSKSYYDDKRKHKMEDSISAIESDLFLNNKSKMISTRKRNPPPKEYQFSLEI